MSRSAAPQGGRDPVAGVVLINVLAVLALTSSVVFAMISLSDISLARSQRFSDAAQAQALVAAGEASAAVVLRRDMQEAPESDHVAEAWAQISQEPVAIAAGVFALQIEDAQGRLNLNSLAGSGAAGAQLLARVVAALELPPDLAARIGARLAQAAPLTRLADLQAEAGVSAEQLARLATLATVLPGRTDININTAPVALLAALTSNPVQARLLEGVRTRNGLLTPADVAAAQVILPQGVGFASRFFRVTTTVTVGETTQAVTSLLQRRQVRGGQLQVVVVARQTAGVPSQAEN